MAPTEGSDEQLRIGGAGGVKINGLSLPSLLFGLVCSIHNDEALFDTRGICR